MVQTIISSPAIKRRNTAWRELIEPLNAEGFAAGFDAQGDLVASLGHDRLLELSTGHDYVPATPKGRAGLGPWVVYVHSPEGYLAEFTLDQADYGDLAYTLRAAIDDVIRGAHPMMEHVHTRSRPPAQ